MRQKIFLQLFGVLFLFILSQTFSLCSSKSQHKKEKQRIIEIEKKWLKNLHNADSLNSILADDFIHPVSQGIFLTKSQQINCATNHPLPKGMTQKFDSLRVRIYGNVGIASGIVETVDPQGKSASKSIFTDVFIKQKGIWQAVNAQENVIR